MKYFNKKSIIAIFLITIAGVGIWLVSINNIFTPVIEKLTNETPEAKINIYIQAIIRGDKESAFKIWEYPTWNLENKDYILLKERRKKITDELIKMKINHKFNIGSIEWWNTCCVPSITDNPKVAGGARIKLELSDANNKKSFYIMDVFNRETNYWESEDYPWHHWVIRDIYPEGQEPLFWTFKS